MTHSKIDPSDSDPIGSEIQELLDAERQRDGVSSDVHERVGRCLGQTLGVSLLALATGEGVASAAGGEAATGGAAALSGKALSSGKAVFGIVGLVLGGVVGAGAQGLLDEPHARALPFAAPALVVVQLPAREQAPPGPEPTHAPEVAPVEVAPPVVAVAAATVAPSASAAAAPGRDLGLAAERALLEVARTALARGDADVALATLNRHRARFPTGRLLEERESLAIQALAMSGRKAQAQARADRFRERSPDSMMLPAINEVLDADN